MKRFLVITLLPLCLLACNTEDDPNLQELSKVDCISFPEEPIELFSNRDFGLYLINYFNIVKMPTGKYRLYFAAFEDSNIENDFDQDLYCAESYDGINYTLTGKIMESIIEQYVFIVEDRVNPYRLIGNVYEDGHYTMCLWESKDGLTFKNRKVLFSEQHDTQQVMIPRDGKLKLYTRIWENNDRKNRRVAVADFDMQGNQLSGLVLLEGNYLYNSAASRLNSKLDIMFPTFYNNRDEGRSDSCYVKNYVIEGLVSTELNCDFNKWLVPEENWVIVAPGFIDINGQKYIAYNTRTRSHDAVLDDVVSKYKLLKVVVE